MRKTYFIKYIEVVTAGLAAAVETQARVTRAIENTLCPALVDLRDAVDRLEDLGLTRRG